jgi:hypothetical protein
MSASAAGQQQCSGDHPLSGVRATGQTISVSEMKQTLAG